MKPRPSRYDSEFGDSGLFRRVALEAQQPGQFGDIVLLPGSSSRWMAVTALLLVLALGLYLMHGSYTRRSTVSGQLAPSEGLIRVMAGQPGLVIESQARDGQAVRRGDVLFVVSGDRVGPDTLNYQRGIAEQIEARIRSLEDELRRLRATETQAEDHARRRAELLRAEAAQVTRQAELLNARLSGADDAYKRYQGLFQQGYVSRDELLSREVELSEARARIQAQARDQIALQREIGTVQRDLEEIRTRHASQRSELERAILVARQEYTEVEARRRVVITAPADGSLTLVQADIGQSVDPTRALAHLVPASSALVARLYVPSRAAGFTRVGDTVLLRYDAFPYQKFGQQAGKVFAVSTAAVAPEELQGLSQRADAALAAGDALFAISVNLPEQTIAGRPLQSGMRMEADLLHETRKLYEWVLEPLYAARERSSRSATE